MNNTDEKVDLWLDFETDEGKGVAGEVAKPKRDPSNGSEWTGKFDRRKTPRDENGNSIKPPE